MAGSGAAARPVGSRLPTAPRERKPALAALAVLLILAGALSTMLLVTRSGHRVWVLRMRHTVVAGQKITGDDLQEWQVAQDDGIHYVLASQENQVVGRMAPSTLIGGALLTTEMVQSQTAALPPGGQLMGVQVKAGHYPPGQLYRGDKVEVWGVSTTTVGTSTETTPRDLGSATIVSLQGNDALTITLEVSGSGMVSDILATADQLSLSKSNG